MGAPANDSLEHAKCVGSAAGASSGSTTAAAGVGTETGVEDAGATPAPTVGSCSSEPGDEEGGGLTTTSCGATVFDRDPVLEKEDRGVVEPAASRLIACLFLALKSCGYVNEQVWSKTTLFSVQLLSLSLSLSLSLARSSNRSGYYLTSKRIAITYHVQFLN